MKYPKIPLAQTVVQLCKQKEIEHIVISPGSRNAPLTIGFTNDSFFKCYSIIDERCAAFFALGMAQQMQKPVALVCTSGSALLNYYPAIAEAFYSDIPLVVLSADRPKHLVGIGDGQTINQKDVFKNHMLYSADLKSDLEVEDTEDELPIMASIENKLERFLGIKQDIQTYNEAEINKAIHIAEIQKGPVHINCPFNEPLYDLADALSVNPKAIEIAKEKASISDDELNELRTIWNSSESIMVLVGVNHPNQLSDKTIETLSKHKNVIVFTESTSNLHHESFFPSIDKIIAPFEDEDFKALQPDLLISFGGLVVSKKIKAFLRNYKPKQHWHIDAKKANDTFFSLSKHIRFTPETVFSSLLPIVENRNSEYLNTFSEIKQHRKHKHKDYLKTIPFSDFIVFDTVLKTLPDNSILQIANSSSIRYMQLFDNNPSIETYCNRGTSGIEGSTSTAIGCAVANKKRTTFITGDLSFFYDSNALWNNYIPSSFRIIVINNGGGGIFRILPGHKNTENFDTYFETKHQLTAEQLCKMFQFEYSSTNNQNELEDNLQNFFAESDSPKLLEVFTPSTINDEVLLEYFRFIK